MDQDLQDLPSHSAFGRTALVGLIDRKPAGVP
jgi:hypothetical protein